MMLSLTMLRCPDSVPPQSRTVEAGEFSIGRGPENDWTLPDPERYLSKRHCVLAFHSEGWKITDHSTNGTYVNRDRAPIGRGHVRNLSDGDRLHMGTYEIEIRMLDQALPKRESGTPALDIEPLAHNFVAPQPGLNSLLQTRTAVDPLSGTGTGTRPAPAVMLPADYDPLAHDPDIDLLGPIERVVLPEDWNLDNELPDPRRPAPPARHGAHSARAAPRAEENLLAAFLRGAGLDEVLPANSVAAMEALGAVFRQMIYGLRRVMIARAKLKAAFRIEQTAIRSHGNNPLKFSANDDDALAALVGSARHGDKAAVDALADALNDIRLHEIATVGAMQAAVRSLLAELDPAKLRETGEAGFNLVSSQRKARAWDAFEAQYERLNRSLGDGFDSAFGKAFARAYEQALIDAASQTEH
ncbi:MAG TPA: type VI secretion system-associated FHA domain protein TagH [Stellaceae bacterium]|nr:type VI secretion system-associated FHA domain protein TagH [Stellaceae bacterium]